jgi:hypothetical protein
MSFKLSINLTYFAENDKINLNEFRHTVHTVAEKFQDRH